MRDAATLRNLAEKFRKLAENADFQTASRLGEIADEYERQALELDAAPQPRMPSPE